ncbi:MAG: hypothetical protein WCP85_04800 [Mariniphaga sp.]
MRVILSRKGFDSEYGGKPSPIIKSKDGSWRYYSLPIPSMKSNKTESGLIPSDIKYSDVKLFDDFKVSDFLKDVLPKRTDLNFCHLDPDIRESSLPNRPFEWKRNFGQVKAAQSHLENNKIGIGDVFLFFGWFQFAEYQNGKFNFIKSSDYPNGFHANYSYLQINEVFKPNIEKVPSWLDYHPHVKFKNEPEFNNPNNTIYVAKELFDCQDQLNKKGSILFTFNENLILTKKGQNNRTLWELPINFHPDKGVRLSYNPTHKWTASEGRCFLKSAFKGQEFVFNDVDEIVEKWCIQLIKMNQVADNQPLS